MRSSSFAVTVMFALVLGLAAPAFGLVVDTPVSQLLKQHADSIAKLKNVAAKQTSIDVEPLNKDIFYLRYCIDQEQQKDKNSDQEDKLGTYLNWRMGAGKSICEAAVQAIDEATKNSEQRWNNEPVLTKAPHSALVSQYLTPDNAITTSSDQQDLVYCIRAGQIDDVALMDAVSIDQMTDFFLYAKEVNSLVCNRRSMETDKLLHIITANDLNGVKLVGGSGDFRKALGASSKQANELYPKCMSGPTLLLNLPPLLSALVKLFTPLFPPEVNARLKFVQGPLKNVQTLKEIAPGGGARAGFMQQLNEIVYQKS